jgi:hypothetical protein
LSIISSNTHLDAPQALERGANLSMRAAAGKRGRTRGVNAAGGTIRRPSPRREIAMSKLDADRRNDLNKGEFAFPKQRKEPLEDAEHVRNAIARFDQVKDVTDAERDEAWKRIKAAAKKFDVDVSETSWHELGSRPH